MSRAFGAAEPALDLGLLLRQTGAVTRRSALLVLVLAGALVVPFHFLGRREAAGGPALACP
jgi:hypothetical protein